MPVIQEKFHNVFTDVDFQDNIYEVDWHPAGLYRIFLKLKSESRKRLIAEVDIAHKIMKMERRKSQHWVREIGGYGFNWCMINEKMAFEVNNILFVEDDFGEMDYYLIPIEEIRKRGKKLNFERAGQELQWFVPIREILEFRIKDISFISPALVGKKS